MAARPSGGHGAAVLLAAALWGTTGTVAHQAPDGASQTLIGLSTFGLGGLLLLALDVRPVVRLLRDRSVLPTLLLGALGVLMYAAFYYWSMSEIGVAVGNALALGSGPVFAALLELVVERRRVALAWACATAVSVAGIACLAASGGDGGDGNTVLGVVLGLAAGFGYALYAWSGARAIGRGHRSRPVMAGSFALASVVLVPVFLAAGPGPLLTTGRGLTIVLYLAVVPMALAYLLFGYGLRGMPASTATTLALAEPIVATLLATLVLHERLSVPGWTGLALVAAGIVLIAMAERVTQRRDAAQPSSDNPSRSASSATPLP